MRKRRRRVPAAVAAALFVVLGFETASPPAEAYLFFGDHGYLFHEGDQPPDSGDALHWAPDVWGPGETLEWWIEDGPYWSETGFSATEAIPFVQRSLDTWAAVSTLDVRWRVAGVSAGVGKPALDGRNSVVIDPDTDHAAEYVWRRGGGLRGDHGHRYIIECDIVNWPHDLARNFSHGVFGRLHGLGHCLGLAHTAAIPLWRSDSGGGAGHWPFSEVWSSGDPVMSYGPNTSEDRVTEDDRIGASLLRPRAGWRASVGTLAGHLRFHDGAPLPHGYVWAIAADGDSMRVSAGAFSRRDGRFAIEGLPPGEYVLWAHPILSRRSLASYVGEEGATAANDLNDTVRPFPVRVAAGRTTDGIEVRVRRGRNAAPFQPGRPSIGR